MKVRSPEQQQAVAALNFIMPLLARHDLRWVITTGFACHVHGVERPITDIDIDVDAASDDPRFLGLMADLSEYITQPLKHYVDARYDNMNFEATVNGQLIDICTMPDMKIFDRAANAYVPFYADGFPETDWKQFFGLTLPVMSKTLIIRNKRMLLEDPAMEPKYRAIHEQDIAGLEANVDLAASEMSDPQTILVLGGGRFKDGSLTNLSLQRLDAAIELFEAGAAPTITVLGGSKSTYLPGALGFDKSGAQERADYLVSKGVPAGSIHQIPDGRDTIGEALTCRDNLPKFGVSSFILITSTLHMPRSQWLFETILGPKYQIQTHGSDCGGLLLADEEAAYLQTTKDYFSSHPGCLTAPGNWHESNPDLYAAFKRIHDEFHPPGKESEAYLAVANAPVTPKLL